MIDTLAGPGTGEADALTASDLLALVRVERKPPRTRAAADLLDLAARWADLHPPESIHSAAAFEVRGSEHEEPIAGEGCPLVAEFCIAELGAVLGISTTSAKKLIGHALELRHRLPRLWSQVHSAQVPAWRARSVAEVTIHTTPVADPSRPPRSSTRRSLRSPDASAPPSSTASSPRPSSGTTSPPPTRPPTRRTATSTSTHATRRSTTRTSTSPAPCGSRPSSTSPTPSTSTGPWRRRRPSRRPSARRSRWTYDVRRPSATSPARRQPWTSSFTGGRVAGQRTRPPPVVE